MKSTHLTISDSFAMHQKARIWGSFVLSAALLGSLGSDAKAQTANPETAPAFAPPTNKERATKLFDQGQAARARNDWTSARDFFKQALEAWPHWQTAANLGFVELQVGRARDAAEHLDWALWELGKLGGVEASTVREVQAKLDEARLKAVTITLVTKERGVELYVDGKYAGTSPLARPVYVEAGARVFEGKKANGDVAREEGVFGFGMAREVRLEGFVSGARLMGIHKNRGEAVLEPPESAWYRWAIVGGGGLAAVGIGMGIGFTLLTDEATKSAEEQYARIVAKQKTLKEDLQPGPTYLDELCKHPSLKADCTIQQQLRGRMERNYGVALGSFVVGGAAAIGTIVLLVAPYISSDSWGKKKSGEFSIAPVLGLHYQGIHLNRTF